LRLEDEVLLFYYTTPQAKKQAGKAENAREIMVAIPSALNKPGDMIALTDKLPVENPTSCRLKVRQIAG
jgi:hypothetical protein